MADKQEFIKKVAERTGQNPVHVETLLDATLSELVSPAVFGTGRGLRLSDNNCGNGCGSEQAFATPVATPQ
jgi:hypothetical protein